MFTRISPVALAVAALALSASFDGSAQRAASPADTTTRIVAAANAVLSSLDDAGRAKLQYRFDDMAQKARWSNFPSPMFQREGLRMGDLTAAQKAAVTNLLKVALSADGYRKVTEIMQGDEVLKTTGGGGGPRGGPPAGGPPQGRGGRGGPGGGLMFGQDQYWLAFLGTPSASAPWMLQFGGHHLAINLTLGGSNASMTPSLPAVRPAVADAVAAVPAGG